MELRYRHRQRAWSPHHHPRPPTATDSASPGSRNGGRRNFISPIRVGYELGIGDDAVGRSLLEKRLDWFIIEAYLIWDGPMDILGPDTAFLEGLEEKETEGKIEVEAIH